MISKALSHIVCLCPGFPRDAEDTTRMPAVHQYVLYLHNNRPDIKVTVVTLQYPHSREIYHWHGIEVHALAAPVYLPIKKVSAWPRILNSLKKIHKSRPIDLIHSFWLGECAVLGQWFDQMNKVTHVCTNIGTELVHKNRYTSLMRLPDLHVICQSTFQEKVLTKRFKTKSLAVIPFGISVPKQTDVAHNNRPIDLLFVGNINPNKNLPQFLETSRLLVEKGMDLKMRVIGDNIHGLDVEGMIHEKGLSGRMDYLGRVDNSRVLEEMAQAKILVHPSYFEAGAFVFMEALASGMYIVSRNVGLVKPQPRWRIAESTDEFVANTVQILNADRDHSALVPYALEDSLKKHLQLYEQLLQENTSRTESAVK